MSFGKVYETTYFGDVKEEGFGKIYFKQAEKSFEYKKQKEKEKEKEEEKKEEKPKKKKK
jgi:CRISPR/Cas system CSM-associated protein Csm3 (group 7 of RAMP superfamily)